MHLKLILHHLRKCLLYIVVVRFSTVFSGGVGRALVQRREHVSNSAAEPVAFLGGVGAAPVGGYGEGEGWPGVEDVGYAELPGGGGGHFGAGDVGMAQEKFAEKLKVVTSGASQM